MVFSEAVASEAARIDASVLQYVPARQNRTGSLGRRADCRTDGHCFKERPAMNPTAEKWKVLPHGPLSALDDGILTVEGRIHMPLMELPRRMTVVRLSDGRLVVWSAIALEENEMARLEAQGRPAFLIVPNDHHRLDARAWKERYPQLIVVAPEGARDKVAEVVPVDSTAPDFADASVQFMAVAGTRGHEAALVVHRPAGSTLVLNDLVGNIRHEQGFGGWLLRLLGFAGDSAHIPAPVKLMLVKDSDALRTQLLQWAELASLKRIVVSHGATIEDHPQQVLRDLAASLK
jgi:hypothetical protein